MRLLFFLSLLQILTFAHPHVFTDVGFEVQIDKSRVEIHVEWRYDEMTSQMIMMDFDRNADGKIDSGELNDLKHNTFDHMSEFQYYTYIATEGKRIKTPKPENFHYEMREGKALYSFQFFIELPKEGKELHIGCFDQENMIAFALDNKKIKVLDNQKKELKYEIKLEDHDYYVADILIFKVPS